MPPFAGRLLATSHLIINLVLNTAYGQDDLPDRIRAANESMLRRTSADLEAARNSLIEATQRLEQYLDRWGANGAAWKDYLLFGTMMDQLRAEGTLNPTELETILARYRAGHPGLELPIFRNVGEALGRYLQIARHILATDFDERYRETLDQLAASVEAYQASPTDADRQQISTALGWLERHGQAILLVEEVQQRLSHPNLYLTVSEEALAALSGRAVDETAPVHDLILGTRISGIGRTLGQVSLRLLPGGQQAMLETVFVGTNYSRTVGRNGPAVICSTGRTCILGRKRFLLGSEGILVYPAKASARTSTHVYAVGSTTGPVLGRVVRRVAWRRIPRQKSQAEWIAARHAEQRFVRQFSTQVNTELAQANSRLLQRLRNPLLRRDPSSEIIQFSSTDDLLRVVAMYEGISGLGAPAPPPELESPPGLVLKLHESLVNNAAAGLLANLTLEQDELNRLATQVLGQVPEAIEEAEEGEPISITFAQQQPIHLNVTDEGVVVTVRAQRFGRGTRKYEGMSITARYQLVASNGGAKAVRQEEVAIYPPGFEPETGRTIPLRLLTLRNLLRRRFSRVFAPEIDLSALALPDGNGRAKPLPLTNWETTGGWLVLGWRRPTPPVQPAGVQDRVR